MTYNSKKIKTMSEGGRILARIMQKLKKEANPGITTKELGETAEKLISEYNAESSFIGFNNYSAVLCASVNEEIVHVVPNDYKLKKGDILSLDLGIRYNGYHADMAITIPIGKISKEKKKLIDVTKEALNIGIEQAKAGNHLGDIGWAIENYVKSKKFDVVRELVGHGIGEDLHEYPPVPNYGKKGEGSELKEGMVLALEPIVVMGNWRIKKCKDRFGYKTKDGEPSAHFEHTIAITEKGPIILTR